MSLDTRTGYNIRKVKYLDVKFIIKGNSNVFIEVIKIDISVFLVVSTPSFIRKIHSFNGYGVLRGTILGTELSLLRIILL